MSKEKPKGKSKVERKTETKISSADDLIKKSTNIELDEEELKRVTGGAVDYFHKAT
jgi:bacteriocin-like protein